MFLMTLKRYQSDPAKTTMEIELTIPPLCLFILAVQEVIWTLSVHLVTTHFLQPSSAAVLEVCRRIVASTWVVGTLRSAYRTASSAVHSVEPWYCVSSTSHKCIMSAACFYLYDMLSSMHATPVSAAPARLVAVVAYAWMAAWGRAHYFGAWFFVLHEMTTPLVHLGWALNQSGGHAAAVLSDLLVALVFIFNRFVLGTYISVLAVKASGNNLSILFLVSLTMFLNVRMLHCVWVRH